MKFLKTILLLGAAGFVLLLVIGAAVGPSQRTRAADTAAQPTPTELEQLAAQAGVNAIDLEGAANATGLSARDYLRSTGELPDIAPTPAPIAAKSTPTRSVPAAAFLTARGHGMQVQGPNTLRAGSYRVKYALDHDFDRDHPTCSVAALLKPTTGEGANIDVLSQTVTAYAQTERGTSFTLPQEGDFYLYTGSSGCDWHMSIERLG